MRTKFQSVYNTNTKQRTYYVPITFDEGNRTQRMAVALCAARLRVNETVADTTSLRIADALSDLSDQMDAADYEEALFTNRPPVPWCPVCKRAPDEKHDEVLHAAWESRLVRPQSNAKGTDQPPPSSGAAFTPDTFCTRCGKRKNEHQRVTDDAGAVTRICRTATFRGP